MPQIAMLCLTMPVHPLSLTLCAVEVVEICPTDFGKDNAEFGSLLLLIQLP